MISKIQLFLLLSATSHLSHGTIIQIGDLLISEVMANPHAVSDTNDE